MAAVALMAKSVSIAALWRFRGGAGQNLSVNLGQALHRLCPFPAARSSRVSANERTNQARFG
jgi:hypothetical protein